MQIYIHFIEKEIQIAEKNMLVSKKQNSSRARLALRLTKSKGVWFKFCSYNVFLSSIPGPKQFAEM